MCNVDEEALPEGVNDHVKKVQARAEERGGETVSVCAKLEAELSELDEGDRAEMLEAVGLTEPALAPLARAAYRLLGLSSYFTAGPMEIRAWTIPAARPARRPPV